MSAAASLSHEGEITDFDFQAFGWWCPPVIKQDDTSWDSFESCFRSSVSVFFFSYNHDLSVTLTEHLNRQYLLVCFWELSGISTFSGSWVPSYSCSLVSNLLLWLVRLEWGRVSGAGPQNPPKPFWNFGGLEIWGPNQRLLDDQKRLFLNEKIVH